VLIELFESSACQCRDLVVLRLFEHGLYGRDGGGREQLRGDARVERQERAHDREDGLGGGVKVRVRRQELEELEQQLVRLVEREPGRVVGGRRVLEEGAEQEGDVALAERGGRLGRLADAQERLEQLLRADRRYDVAAHGRDVGEEADGVADQVVARWARADDGGDRHGELVAHDADAGLVVVLERRQDHVHDAEDRLVLVHPDLKYPAEHGKLSRTRVL